MPSVPFLILDAEIIGLSAEVRVNEVTLTDVERGPRIARAAKINGWCVRGANRLTVRLGRRPDQPAEDGEDAPQPAFELKIRSALPDSPEGADQVLAAYTWRAETSPLPPAGRIAVFETVFQAQPPQPWSWTRGYAFTALAPADREGIAELLGQLTSALSERQIETVVGLQSMQVGEQAIALGEPPETFLAAYRAFLRDRMGPADWRVAPFDPRVMRTELMADGRVVHVTAADGDPPVVANSSDGFFAIDPYLSRIDGRWTIVR